MLCGKTALLLRVSVGYAKEAFYSIKETEKQNSV